MKNELENLHNLFFLGAKGEQRKFFQEMVELVNTDMVFWRRNFHPKDPPHIPYHHLTSPIGQAYQEEFIQSLAKLLADLKMDIPFFSPRYLAHMTADVSLPGLLGYYAGLLYNANNVSGEASPVTLKYELEVGKEFAHLFGYDQSKSFGHITSGGTVANFESVFYNKASRFIPATMGLIIKKQNINWPSFLPDDLWQLLNIKLGEIPALLNEFKKLGFEAEQLIEKYSPAYLGDGKYWQLLQETFKTTLGPPVIIVPSTAHYSWSKASHLFGLGRENCLQVRVNKNLVMCASEFEKVIHHCQQEKKPIIQTVCILGTTEFGSFDPLDEILAVLKKWHEKNVYSPIHIDGAYGGYFQAMFTEGIRFPQIAKEAQAHDPRVYKIFQTLKETDSITVDPHKLGHTPTGVGVFITKHGFVKEFVAEGADYCLSSQESNPEDFPLGKYILEGSKSGASATSVYFSNKMIPLNSDGYGGLLHGLVVDTESFYQELLKLSNDISDFSQHLEIIPIAPPQSNLLCFYIKPKNMKKLTEINDFNLSLIKDFFPHHTNHIHDFDYFVSKTKIKKSKLTEDAANIIFSGFELDTDSLLLMRIVVLNRWSSKTNGSGESYLMDFLSMIKRQCLNNLRDVNIFT